MELIFCKSFLFTSTSILIHKLKLRPHRIKYAKIRRLFDPYSSIFCTANHLAYSEISHLLHKKRCVQDIKVFGYLQITKTSKMTFFLSEFCNWTKAKAKYVFNKKGDVFPAANICKERFQKVFYVWTKSHLSKF